MALVGFLILLIIMIRAFRDSGRRRSIDRSLAAAPAALRRSGCTLCHVRRPLGKTTILSRRRRRRKVYDRSDDFMIQLYSCWRHQLVG